MLRLDLHREPVWLQLAAGVRLCLAPLTTALMVSARDDPAVQEMPDAPDEDRALAHAKAIARRALLGWEGVGDADGDPDDPTPVAIDALLDLYPVFEAFQLKYVNKGLLLDAEKKKRLAALAEWHFGGGQGYCDACPSPCPDYPGRLNLPQTVEGWQVWDLATRMGGQLRVVPGGVVGWDMTAALAMADALGVNTLVMAEILPVLERVAVERLNAQMASAVSP